MVTYLDKGGRLRDASTHKFVKAEAAKSSWISKFETAERELSGEELIEMLVAGKERDQKRFNRFYAIWLTATVIGMIAMFLLGIWSR